MDHPEKQDSFARSLALGDFWNWLIAFRVVGETEHLPSASKALGVSTSALSRSIHLLEDRLGVALFRKQGRRISLTRAGGDFLAAVRLAMRAVHDGMLDVEEKRFVGELLVASSGLATRAYVLPAALALRSQYPGLNIAIETRASQEIIPALLQGALDVAITENPLPHAELLVEKLSSESHGIYCGVDHPLYDAADIDVDTISAHAFAGPSGATEGWPAEIPRRIELRASQMQVGIDACANGALLAVLPDTVARGEPLRRLPLDVIPNTYVYAVTRSPLRPGRAEAMVDAIRAQITDFV